MRFDGEEYNIKPWSLKFESCQCYKCGLPFHISKRCDNPRCCWNCGADHDTDDCPVKGTDVKHCAVCKATDHRTSQNHKCKDHRIVRMLEQIAKAKEKGPDFLRLLELMRTAEKKQGNKRGGNKPKSDTGNNTQFKRQRAEPS
ncbi:uncharacterized protein K460DRAFT_370698 [Cucurbitaria berberidis CBS 394.84]|uniref:CCHC-type domain-containing protein n=1 Tax=Cucurbitaria berberidis CBS 394.84 TaxID=1168544 RepID=A0A9P4L3T9_9PLEO|nr:uncharacterized protein K460DRAFT_370698 [Cucurbitaria berberidis CBS 394.84]KAF1840740.1 hypothetical protein K460DRAFT_370698 [Cucurbitaria berberidis CBS 394.84]